MNRTFILCLQNLFLYRFPHEGHLIVKLIYSWTTISLSVAVALFSDTEL